MAVFVVYSARLVAPVVSRCNAIFEAEQQHCKFSRYKRKNDLSQGRILMNLENVFEKRLVHCSGRDIRDGVNYMLRMAIRFAMLFAVCEVFVFLDVSGIYAETIIGPGKKWSVVANFKKDSRKDISGAVCPGDNGTRDWCLVINDEKNTKNKPKQVMDAEAAAYDNGFVYIAGSHGLSREDSVFQNATFLVQRFPVDKLSGKPTFEVSKDVVSSEIELSYKLRQIIKKDAYIKEFAEVPLADNGANIEGLAVVSDIMYFGFRGPSIDQNAFVIGVPVNTIFANYDNEPAVTEAKTSSYKLNLGVRMGIRDMAKVNDGILILSGDVNSSNFASQIHFWNPYSNQLIKLGKLHQSIGKKAETLLLLEESIENQKISYRFLILFDSIKNGGPTEFQAHRDL